MRKKNIFHKYKEEVTATVEVNYIIDIPNGQSVQIKTFSGNVILWYFFKSTQNVSRVSVTFQK